MKIKRYEASSMTEALRKIKKDFGEDAVILSAKTSKKPGGLFSIKSSGKVVVTAAIDMTPAGKKGAVAVKSGRAEKKARAAESNLEKITRPVVDQVFLSEEPAVNVGAPKVSPKRKVECEVPQWYANQSPKLVPLKSEALLDSSSKASLNADLYKNFRAKGLNPVISHELADQIYQLAGNCAIDAPRVKDALTALIEERGWIADPVAGRKEPGKPIVLVGVHGAGKTTTAVKLAAEALLGHKKEVTLLSLDYQRIAAHVELKRAAHVMGLEVLTAAGEQQLQELIPQIPAARHTIIDTTGVAIGEEAALEELAALLAHLGEVEIHLVLNACLQEAVAARMIDFYRSLGVTRLLFTQTDNIDNIGHLFNLIDNCELPVSYMGHGAQVPGDLQVMHVETAAGMLLPQGSLQSNDADRSMERAETTGNPDAEMSAEVLCDKDRHANYGAKQSTTSETEEEFQPLFKEYRQAGGQGSQTC